MFYLMLCLLGKYIIFYININFIDRDIGFFCWLCWVNIINICMWNVGKFVINLCIDYVMVFFNI